MADRYDCIIVGGGIAGLFTAVRLASHGLRVALFEKNRLGAQASTSNHGMIHSGALYAELHPEIVGLCAEAVSLFRQTFPSALVSSDNAWLFGSSERLEYFFRLWEQQGVAFHEVDVQEAGQIFRTENLPGFTYASTEDQVVSSRAILVDLALICMRLKVEIFTESPVSSVLVEGTRAVGVRLGSGEVISSSLVILCSGLGTSSLFKTLSLGTMDRLKSRLDMMVAFKGRGLTRSILCLEYGGVTIAPTCEDTVLTSLYGGSQPWVREYRRWAVPLERAVEITNQLHHYFRDGLLDLSSGLAYMCSKTEVCSGHADPWGVEPGFLVIDHSREDNIENLWTVIPGKMTLAFHASRDLVSQILRTPVNLTIPNDKSDSRDKAELMVETPPWRNVETESTDLVTP
jgi:glycine/D-amino acid oxidase-like deaminating enzyme